jgi:hypothetical protein
MYANTAGPGDAFYCYQLLSDAEGQAAEIFIFVLVSHLSWWDNF